MLQKDMMLCEYCNTKGCGGCGIVPGKTEDSLYIDSSEYRARVLRVEQKMYQSLHQTEAVRAALAAIRAYNEKHKKKEG